MKIDTADIYPFYMALKTIADSDWKQENGLLAEKANISGGYLSEILKSKKTPSHKVAFNLAKACGYDYELFLQLGRDLIQREKGSASLTEHRSIKKTNTEECEANSTPMDQDAKKILQDHIELLKQNEEKLRADLERERQEHKNDIERERHAHERTTVNLRADLEKGRLDLERERQTHERAMAELREDYNELKAEAKDLRLEYKQLLEQYRALKQKKTQSSQSPDNSEKKKAVNQ